MIEPIIVKLPKIGDIRGNLSFIQFPDQLAFEIKRTFWTYDVPSGKVRGGHAYWNQSELVVALSGSFFVKIFDENMKTTSFYMNRSDYGLFLPPLSWRVIENFSTNSLALHLSSHTYLEADYIKDFEVFKKAKIERNHSI